MMDSFSSTYSVGHAVVGGFEFTATSSTGNLQRTLDALKYEEHQTTGISAPCCETVESIIRESCHVFWGTFVKCGSVMLNRNTFLRAWLRQKKKSQILSCLCVRWSHKALFYFCTWQNICINIFKTVSLLRLANQTTALRSQILSFTGSKAQTQMWYRDIHTHTHTHQFCFHPKLLRHH